MWKPQEAPSGLLVPRGGYLREMRDVLECLCSLVSLDEERVVAGYGDGTIAVWNAKKCCVERILEGHCAPITGLIRISGNRIASKAWEEMAPIVWNPYTGERDEIWTEKVCRAKFATGDSMFGSPGCSYRHIDPFIRLSGDRLITTSEDYVLHVWDVCKREVFVYPGGNLEEDFGGEFCAIVCMTALEDDRIFTSHEYTAEVRIWDLDGHPPYSRGVPEMTEKDDYEVEALAPLGSDMLVGISGDSTLDLWEIGSWRRRTVGNVGMAHLLVKLGKHRFCVNGGEGVQIYDHEREEITTLKGSPSAAGCLAKVDAETVAVGESSGKISVWNVRTEEERALNIGSEPWITDMSVCPGSTRFARFSSGEVKMCDTSLMEWTVMPEGERDTPFFLSSGGVCCLFDVRRFLSEEQLGDGLSLAPAYRGILGNAGCLIEPAGAKPGGYRAESYRYRFPEVRWNAYFEVIDGNRIAACTMWGRVEIIDLQSNKREVIVHGPKWFDVPSVRGSVTNLWKGTESTLCVSLTNGEIWEVDIRHHTREVRQMPFFSTKTEQVRNLYRMDAEWFAAICIEMEGDLEYRIRLYRWNACTDEFMIVTEMEEDIRCFQILSSNVALAGLSNGEIYRIDLEAAKITRIGEHEGSVSCLCALPDGAFASAGRDKKILLWHPQEDESIAMGLLHFFPQHLVYDPENGTLWPLPMPKDFGGFELRGFVEREHSPTVLF